MTILVIVCIWSLIEAWKEEIKKMNNWGIRLAIHFGIKEFFRCLRYPLYKAPKDHKFCWGRILFWYVDFDLETSKKHI